MGQEQTKQHSLINNKNWRLIAQQQSQVFHNINPYCNRALHNSFTNQYVQEYQLQFTSQQEFISYSKQLQLRKQPAPYQLQAQNNSEQSFRYSPYIYKVKYFINTSAHDLCSTIHKGLLYIQKVDLRLKEINDIPFATLNGFKALYQKVGYFDISEEMIFITCRGKVRVWMNPNLSKNHPYYIPKTYQSNQLHGSQSEMIVNLINIIEENTDIQNSIKIHFKQYLINKGIFDRLSFYKAIDQFQIYCIQNRISVNDYMRSIFQLYHQEGYNLSESRAERSQVVRLETNREMNSILGLGQVRSNYKTHQRNHSPDFTNFKKSQLSSSHASYKSMGQKQRKSQFKNQMEEPIYKFIPTLPLNKSKGNQPRDLTNQLSFRNPSPNPSPNQHSYDMFNNQLSFGQIPNIAYPHLSRRNNLRNIRRNNQQTSKVNQPSNPIVTFNYSKAQSQPNAVIDKKIPANNQRTVNTMNSMSSFSVKETQLFFESKSKQYQNQNSKIPHNSPQNIYALDSEIVEDLKKFLGFDIDKL